MHEANDGLDVDVSVAEVEVLQKAGEEEKYMPVVSSNLLR